ncbi:MAG: Clp protease N-terminal domain-containing protein, partial [Roseibium sp.]
MRIDKLTSKLQSALADAQSIAVGKDHNFIEPVHLMLALLDQQGGSVKPLLQQVGVEPGRVRQAVANEIGTLPEVQGNAGDVSMSNDMGRLFNISD